MKKTVIVCVCFVVVAVIMAAIIYKSRKKPSIEIGGLMTDFGSRRVFVLPEDMTVGQIINHFSGVKKSEAFTVEWFLLNNPKYSGANVGTVIEAGESVYYPGA